MDQPPVPPPRDRWLALACVAGIIICFCMTLLEFSRALEGNPRSLAYTFEWPAFGAFIVWIWRKLERRNREEALGGQPETETSAEIDGQRHPSAPE